MSEEEPRPIIASHIVALPLGKPNRAMTAEIAIRANGAPHIVTLKGQDGKVTQEFTANEVERLCCLPPGALFLLRVRPEDGFMSEHMVSDVELRLDVPLSNSDKHIDFVIAWQGATKVYDHFAQSN